jgi:hypothetical protein
MRLDRFLRDLARDHRRAVAHAVYQGVVAKNIEPARIAAGFGDDVIERVMGKNLDPAARRHLDAKIDIGQRLERRQVADLGAHRDALIELAQFVARQFLVQLRLAGEHDLEEFLLIAFEIG